MTGSRGIMQQSRCHCGWPADTMLAGWSRRHPDELDGCSRGQTPGASRQLGETFVRSVHHPLFKQHLSAIDTPKKIGRLSIWCLHALERAQSHEELSYQPLCLSSFITPLTMNYYLNNQKWQPVNWSSVIRDDDHLATSTLTVMKMIDFLQWFYAGGHAAVSVKQQADSEWRRLGEAEEVYWGLWSRRLITTAAAHYSLSLKLCGEIVSVIWFNLWSKWLKIHHWCMKLPVSAFKILHLRGFLVQLKLLLQVTGENVVLHMQYNLEYCRRTHTPV